MKLAVVEVKSLSDGARLALCGPRKSRYWLYLPPGDKTRCYQRACGICGEPGHNPSACQMKRRGI
jgi:hypothetical protein